MKRTSVRELGFTLIELLVVISIIGILAAMATLSFTGVQKQARDTQRKSDLAQYRSSLELFANSNSLYPGENSTVSADDTSSGLCKDLGVTSCPSDPKHSADATYDYKYQSDGSVITGAAVATKYVLWGKIENVTNMFWVVCSTGQSGKIASGTGISGGTCPAGLTP